MSGWIEGRVLENRAWTEALFSLKVRAEKLSFQAGQFVRVALDLDGERIARPFSFVNAPGDPVMEFYGVIVPQGPLSPHLARLKAGDPLYVADNPSGFLVLGEVAPAEDLWLVSTGTGIAPFLSILRTEEPWRRFRRVILVHCARHGNELVYQGMIRGIADSHGSRFVFIKFTTREKTRDAIQGRVPAAIADGRLEAAAGAAISPEHSQFMLCGNPAMLKDVSAVLATRGLRKNRRRTPGHITVESFW
jgi:ferredoxin--NADP+ reductase